MTHYRTTKFDLTTLLLLTLALAAMIGCSKPAATAPAKLHILAVLPGADVDVMARYAGKEYMLSVDRSGVPLSVAYYEPIAMTDAGQDLAAQLNGDEFEVTVPGRGMVRYNVEGVREVQP
jgi:hypothetical protein